MSQPTGNFQEVLGAPGLGKQWAVSTERWARVEPPASPSLLTLPLLAMSVTARLSQRGVQGRDRVASRSFYPAAGGIP